MIDAPHYRLKFAIAIAEPAKGGTSSLEILGDAAIEIIFQANCEIPRIPSTVGMYLSSAVKCLRFKRVF